MATYPTLSMKMNCKKRKQGSVTMKTLYCLKSVRTYTAQSTTRSHKFKKKASLTSKSSEIEKESKAAMIHLVMSHRGSESCEEALVITLVIQKFTKIS